MEETSLPGAYQQRLDAIRAADQWRARREMQRHEDGTVTLEDGRRLINFSDNDYLGLSFHYAVVQAAQQAAAYYGTGAGAARLVTGSHPLYAELERALATFKGTEDALIFGSGYLMNMGVVPALVGAGDLILADKLIHASLVDAMRLSGADFIRFRHNDADHAKELLEKKRKDYQQCLILTEGVFSMDGDLPPLAELCTLAEAHDSLLLLDDAHGFGVLAEGKGTAAALGVTPKPYLLQLGTLSKALGAYGGYFCGSKAWVEYFIHHARTAIYTTALPPATLAAALAGLHVIQQAPERTAMPLTYARYFCENLGLPEPSSPIVPVMVGESDAAIHMANKLEDAGFLTIAIRPPTVPPGKARLRVTFSASHSRQQVDALIKAFEEHKLSYSQFG